jgi:hypothetical protein
MVVKGESLVGRAPRVYQESGGVAGEIAPLGRAPDMGAMGKELQKFQKKGSGLSPSLTFFPCAVCISDKVGESSGKREWPTGGRSFPSR